MEQFRFPIGGLSSQQSISKCVEIAKLPPLIYSLDTILLDQIIQVLCLHPLMSSLPLNQILHSIKPKGLF